MPYLEITMPRTTSDDKQRLASDLTQEFIDATGFENEVLHIHFRDYGSGEVAVAGRLWDGSTGKPYLNFVLWCPRLRFDVKRSVVAGLTAAFTRAVDKEDWKPAIHIVELPYDNIGVDGELLTDADDELASRPYYYVLPR